MTTDDQKAIGEPLYGFDGDEDLQDDPAEVYERWADDNMYDEDSDDEELRKHPESLEILEWSAIPLAEMLTPAQWTVDSLLEYLAEECGWEGAEQALERAGKDPEVLAAYTEARRVLGSKLAGFRMAHKRLRTLTVTFAEDGKPLLDGEPMYEDRSVRARRLMEAFAAVMATEFAERAQISASEALSWARDRWEEIAPGMAMSDLTLHRREEVDAMPQVSLTLSLSDPREEITVPMPMNLKPLFPALLDAKDAEPVPGLTALMDTPTVLDVD